MALFGKKVKDPGIGVGAGSPQGTPTPYIPYNYTIASNYEYSGVIPAGPFRGAWPGVQKTNAIANVGVNYATYAYLPNGAQRVQGLTAQQTNRVANAYGFGIANSQLAQQYSLVNAANQQSATRTSRIMNILRGQGY